MLAGQALAFVRGSTAAIATMEFELDSHAHQRATLIGPSETVPVLDGRLAVGTWQALVLIDFDDRPRERTVIVQLSD